MDINDLVRELSKSSTSPATPPSVSGSAPQAPRSSFPTPKPPMTPPVIPPPATVFSGAPPKAVVNPPLPKPPETPRPQFSVPPKLSSIPSPITPLPTPGVKEYHSSIRTMNEDISKVKQGQQPTGIPVPRKVEQVVPVPPAVPLPTKPTIPAPQFKVPSVKLGETQKAAPLAPSKNIPGITIPIPKVSFGVPSVPKTGVTEPAPQIYVPQGEQKGGNRNILFIGIGAVAIAAGFAYWFFILKLPTSEVVTESPTPTPTATPALTPIPTLTSIFYGVPKQSVSIKTTNPLTSFVSDIGKAVVDSGAFKTIEAVDSQTPPVSYGFADLVTKLALKIPGELVSNFGNDSAMFIYGQKESFDSNGNLLVGVATPNRIVIVAELKNPSGVSQAAIAWETTLSSDLKTLFGLGSANKNQPGFLDNSYRNTSIRYRNFPYANNTIDYAIVSAFNGKTYFVVADSREAIFAVIDKLVNF